ncbi:hypothetical protein SAMN06265338_101596 [Rhodoblastus acidophilus]|uniref:Uncharacterized protein n=1 Tax=Rhodoblastus acidophilus TaxID=1074 RepID=A0A212QIH8_RHOAC|nr:hypothetical protein [Rhodoblastus acidophilus]PPQ39991.1 hypothetical protein CKO16_04090 [Rhodoblastus acidophilus]RAI23236.1 hypothetical protein CH337_03105 [Rhodoblastus acidophilus]SNB59164.1 hypothetical protein SAMN06265338_101596 [Rhodoblastus acidophilus]
MSVLSTSAATSMTARLQHWRQPQAGKANGAADAFPDPAADDASASFLSSVTTDAWTPRETPAPSVAAQAAASLQDELFSLLNAAAASGQGVGAERAQSTA